MNGLSKLTKILRASYHLPSLRKEATLMLKFKFNHLQNTLAVYQNKTWTELPPTNQFTAPFGGLGFKLDSGWIIFTIRAKKIQVFYKQISVLSNWVYFKKDLPKQAPVIFAFGLEDEVEKVNGKWIKKGEYHA